MVEEMRIALQPGQRLQYHAVLVALAVDGRDRPLRERIAERDVDRGRRYLQARGGLAIDGDRHLRRVGVRVGRDVDKARLVLQARLDAALPQAELFEIVAKHVETVLPAGALLVAAAEIARGEQYGVQTGDRVQLFAQPLDDRTGLSAGLRARLQRHDERPLVGQVEAVRNADGGAYGGHCGIAQDDIDHALLLGDHLLERRARRPLRGAAQQAGILVRHEVLRHRAIQIERDEHGQYGDEQHRPAMAKAPVAAYHVASCDVGEAALEPLVHPRQAAARLVIDETATHHRRERQRHDGREHDGDRQRPGEFMQDAPEYAAA